MGLSLCIQSSIEVLWLFAHLETLNGGGSDAIVLEKVNKGLTDGRGENECIGRIENTVVGPFGEV